MYTMYIAVYIGVYKNKVTFIAKFNFIGNNQQTRYLPLLFRLLSLTLAKNFKFCRRSVPVSSEIISR